MVARRRIPESIQVGILIESRRRCAMCFHLHEDLTVKDGQLAHIDRDASNDAEGNVIFLCLIHHNQYDTKSSQAKGWLPAELTEIKRRFEQAIVDRRHLVSPAAIATAGRETDRETLRELIAFMSESNALRFLRGVRFASHSFVNWELIDLEQLARSSNGAENEFIDPDVEALRKDLVSAAEAFFEIVYIHTRRVPWNENCRAVPEEWETKELQRYEEAVRVLDAASLRIVNAYDELVRFGRARLLP